MKGNPAGNEKRAVAEWASVAKPDAKAAIMYIRTLESDPHVKELRNMLVTHFSRIAHVPTEFTAIKLFSADAFRDYFNKKTGITETYGNYEFRFRDFDHYKDWLLSFSYMPNDAFQNEEAAQALSDFYAGSAHRQNGVASVMQGIRMYTGFLNQHP